MAVAKALQKAGPPLVIHTDYEGVVKRLWDWLRTASRFARLWETIDQRIGDIGWGQQGASIEWAKSHRVESSLPTGSDEHDLVMGNEKGGHCSQAGSSA